MKGLVSQPYHHVRNLQQVVRISGLGARTDYSGVVRDQLRGKMYRSYRSLKMICMFFTVIWCARRVKGGREIERVRVGGLCFFCG